MAAYGNSVYMAWNDNRFDQNNLQLFYTYSTDNGVTWNGENAMSALPAVCYSPTVQVGGPTGETVIVAMRNVTSGYINALQSLAGGTVASFNSPGVQIENAVNNSGYEVISIDGQNVHVTFGQIGNALYNYYMTSSDNGNTYTAPAIVATWPALVAFSTPLFIASSGGSIHLAWSMLTGSPGGHTAIYYTNNNVTLVNASATTGANPTTTSGGTTTGTSSDSGTASTISAALWSLVVKQFLNLHRIFS